MNEKKHDEEFWMSVIGESIHSGFRKGTDHPEAHRYWKLISDMPQELWDDLLGWTTYCLDEMGLIKVEA